MNFFDSIKQKDSRLIRVLKYLRDKGEPMKRSDIIAEGLGRPDADPRGWGSLFFAGAVQAGFIQKTGRSTATRYMPTQQGLITLTTLGV